MQYLTDILRIEKKIYQPIQMDPTALMTLRSVPSAMLLILSKRTNGAIPFPSHIWFWCILLSLLRAMTASPPGREKQELCLMLPCAALHCANLYILTNVLHFSGWWQKHIYYKVVANLFCHILLLFQGLSCQGPEGYSSLFLNIYLKRLLKKNIPFLQ